MHRGAPLLAFHPNRPGLVAPARLDPAGRTGPTRGQANGPHWRRVSHGFYVPATVAHTVDQRIVEAAAGLPSYGGVTGWATLRWLGGHWFDGRLQDGRTERPVVLATCCADIRSQRGIQVSAERLNPADLSTVDGLTITTAERALLFEMRHAPDVREAVVAVEMAACDDILSTAEAAAYAERLPAWTGIPQARSALMHADEDSWSPWETRLRLIWVLDAELPPPVCNMPVFDLAGNHIGTPDLLDEDAGLVGEYDGGLHLAGHQRRKDVARESRFRAHELEYFSVVGGDMWRPELVVERIHSARARARWTPLRRRLWTTDPPSWWVSARGVDARRELKSRRRAQ